MTRTEHAPLPLEQGQCISYTAPDGTECSGTVLSLVPPHRRTAAKQSTYTVQRSKDGRVVDVKERWIREATR